MAQFKCEIEQRLWNGLKWKAEQTGTTADDLAADRLAEFAAACVRDMEAERRERVSRKLFDLPLEKLDKIEAEIEAEKAN